MPHIPKEICAYCKGVKRLCGEKICPILVKQSHLIEGLPRIMKREFQGITPPNIFVGEYNYPVVNFGPLSTYQYSVPIDDPEIWAKKRLDIIEILKIRLGLVYSYSKKKVREAVSLSNELKEVIISLRPVDLDVVLKKEPRVVVRLDADIPPMGASGQLEKVDVVGNPLTSRKIESVLYEDAKAAILARELYNYGLNFYYIQRLLSAGLLGTIARRRFVPTRWSITATDAILGKYFLDRIKYYQPLGTPRLHYHEYLGNKYYLLLIPSNFWAMEMFEIWLPFSVWVRHGNPVVINIHEDYDGKPNKYDGGYFAIRYGVLEYLKNIKRKAAVLAIRIITPRYIAPVGSWQIRESVRIALSKPPILVGEEEKLVQHVIDKEYDNIRLNIKKKSWLLKRLKTPTLEQFLKI